MNMCRCPKVGLYEVEFKLDGMRSIAQHKNCGELLSEQQQNEIQKQMFKLWGIKGEE
ncbi:MAG: hypothetical protein QW416_00105 [Candidatus Nitrosocaldaceae archaeon]